MSVKRVFSAGGIILRKDGGDVKVLLTQHSKHKGWDFPKGHLKVAENSQQAAVREVEEETGVKGEVLEKAGQTQYFYWEEVKPTSAKASVGKQKCFKTVNYYFMKFISQGEATTAFEVSGKKWLPVEKVEEQLTFKTTKEMWGEARNRIARLKLNA